MSEWLLKNPSNPLLLRAENLRKGLSNCKPAEAINTLIAALRKYPTNADLLKIIPG